MGDRTSMTAIIHDCPPEKAGDVLDAMEEYYHQADETPDESDKDTLVLGDPYVTYETYVGNSSELASALSDIEGVAFEVWEDPKYEWLGTLHLHTPALGSFSADCDSGGGAYFPASTIWEWLDADHSPESIADFVGKTHRDALDALVPDETVLHRPTEEDADE